MAGPGRLPAAGPPARARRPALPRRPGPRRAWPGGLRVAGLPRSRRLPRPRGAAAPGRATPARLASRARRAGSTPSPARRATPRPADSLGTQAPYAEYQAWQPHGAPGGSPGPDGYGEMVNGGDYAYVIRQDDPAAPPSRPDPRGRAWTGGTRPTLERRQVAQRPPVSRPRVAPPLGRQPDPAGRPRPRDYLRYGRRRMAGQGGRAREAARPRALLRRQGPRRSGGPPPQSPRPKRIPRSRPDRGPGRSPCPR